MYALKGPNMIKRRIDARVPIKHQQKDMRRRWRSETSSRRRCLRRAAANEMYKTARRMGKDDEDFSAVIAAIGKK